jgi:hypothetical protein
MKKGSMFELNWRKSRPHLLFLTTFLQPRSPDDHPTDIDWRLLLGEPPEDAVERFKEYGAVVRCNLGQLMEHRFTVEELKEMLRTRDLPVSGRKTDLIMRLIQNDVPGMREAVADIELLECSEGGREIAEQFLTGLGGTIAELDTPMADSVKKMLLWLFLNGVVAGVVGNLAYDLLKQLVPADTLPSPPPPPTIPLRNSGFEEGFTQRGSGDIEVAVYWEPWWIQGTPELVAQGWFFWPAYKPENAAIYGMRRVHSGNFSQKQFNTYAHHCAGLFQVVSGIMPGSTLRFSIWAQVWSSSQSDPDQCEGFGNYQVWVGIDPTGGRDGNSDDIVWSQPVMTCNEWVFLEVTAVAQSSNITVFTRGEPEFRVKHNDAYWDDASLTVQ